MKSIATMKIQSRDLQDGPLSVEVLGTEDWLKPVCSWFGVPAGESAPLLKANLTVALAGDFVWAEGQFSFAPFIPCDLCCQPLPVVLKGKISRSYGLESPRIEEKEKVLEAQELDEFYLTDGCLDLGEMLNEVVQLSLPASHRHDAGHQDCLSRNDHDHQPLWASRSASQKAASHPFAALRNLKVPAEP